MKKYLIEVKNSALISLLSVVIGSSLFAIIDHIELLFLYGFIENKFFDFSDTFLFILLYSFIILSIPAVLGGGLISHYSRKDLLANHKNSTSLSIKRGMLIAGICVLFMIIPVLIFHNSLAEYQRYKFIEFSIYINPYIRSLIAILIACIIGAFMGRKIHAKNSKQF